MLLCICSYPSARVPVRVRICTYVYVDVCICTYTYADEAAASHTHTHTLLCHISTHVPLRIHVYTYVMFQCLLHASVHHTYYSSHILHQRIQFSIRNVLCTYCSSHILCIMQPLLDICMPCAITQYRWPVDDQLPNQGMYAHIRMGMCWRVPVQVDACIVCNERMRLVTLDCVCMLACKDTS